MPRYKASPPPGLRGISPRKSLGQNFLIDTGIRDVIIEAAQLLPSDVVLEVGPGAGTLTEKLATQLGSVIAIELDSNLAVKLREKLANFNNLKIIQADILKLKLEQILNGAVSYKVIANIPYYITSPILHYFAHAATRPSLMVMMLQKEVAIDVIAAKGRMSYLAVAMQLFYRVKQVCLVSPASFYPPPKVHSSVIRFTLRSEPAIAITNLDKFLALVHACFAAPRKMLRNSLAIGLKLDTRATGDILNQAGIDPSRRAETLTWNEWGNLYNIVERQKLTDTIC